MTEIVLADSEERLNCNALSTIFGQRCEAICAGRNEEVVGSAVVVEIPRACRTQ